MKGTAGVMLAVVLAAICGLQPGCGDPGAVRDDGSGGGSGAAGSMGGATPSAASAGAGAGGTVTGRSGDGGGGPAGAGGGPAGAGGGAEAAGGTSSAFDPGRMEGDTTLAFEDATRSAGLLEPLDCMMGHAVAFGDVDADGWPDLFFGTFTDRPESEYECANGARPNRFFRNAGAGAFVYQPEPAVEQYGRASGALFADLDGDGDSDLVIANNARSSGDARLTLSNLLLRNDGATFTDVTTGSGLTEPGMAARNVVPLDYDGDGQLDLFIVGDMFGGVGSRLFRNLGGLAFEDRTGAAGLSAEAKGLGAAAADVNNDGWPDLFISHADQLWVNDGHGSFEHVSELDGIFAWPAPGSEDWRAGAAFGDVNRDGWLDLVVAHHYDSAWTTPVPIRLYMNRSEPDAAPSFEYVADVGLTPIGIKSPHLEIQDFDNDGWPDIYVSVHIEQQDGVGPLVFQNQRVAGAIPAFATAPFIVASGGVKNIGYGAAGATVDYDRDGRLDMLITEWWANLDSTLYRNVSASGNYLDVAIRSATGTNPIGIGARVELFEAGRLGEAAARIGRSEIMSGYGYSSGQEAVCHFGLADRSSVDVRVVLPHGGATIDLREVDANQRLLVP